MKNLTPEAKAALEAARGNAPDPQTAEAQAAGDRLGSLWSDCPGHGGHTWDVSAGKCIHCEAAFPYSRS